jgi:hypothetical protein
VVSKCEIESAKPKLHVLHPTGMGPHRASSGGTSSERRAPRVRNSPGGSRRTRRTRPSGTGASQTAVDADRPGRGQCQDAPNSHAKPLLRGSA